MKETLKKLTIALLVIVLGFQIIYSNFPVYGIELEDGVTWLVNTLTNVLGGVIGIHTRIPRYIAMGLGFGVNVLTAQIAYMDGETPTATGGALSRITITPFEIFFNEIQLLDVNFLDVSVGGTTGIIREAVAGWYYIMRLIAVSILLLILLYVGIRMALSSVASEKAIYKRALVDWVTSLALVFLLQYIIMFTIHANNAIVAALKSAVKTTNVDDKILGIAMMSLGISFESIAATVVYCIFVFQVIMFLIRYIKRMITIAFLIIISPLISITYSIDKIGDQKAQALNAWLKEFVYNVLIQPFHCVIYMAFIDTAFSLLTEGGDSIIKGILSLLPSIHGVSDLANGVLAVVCMWFVDDAEKIVKKIFGLDSASSLSSKVTTMFLAKSVYDGAKKVGQHAPKIRKAVNGLASTAGSIGKSASNIGKKIASSSAGQRIANSGVAKTIGGAAKTVGNAGKAVGNAGKRVGKWTGSKISSVKNAVTAPSESAIEKRMLKNLDGNQEAFDELKRKKGTPEWEAKYEEAKDGIIQDRQTKKDKRAERIKTFRGNVVQSVKENLPAGVAFFSMSALSNSPLQAVLAGDASYDITKNLLKTSTGTIASETQNYIRSTDESSAISEMQEVYKKGEENSYESDRWDSLIKEMQTAVGNNKLGRDIAEQIRYALLSEGMANIPDILSKAGVSGNANAQSTAESCSEFQREALLYKQVKIASETGIGIEKLASKLDYSAIQGRIQAGASGTVDSGTNTGGTVEHIHRTIANVTTTEDIKNVQETIEKVDIKDKSELDSIVQKLTEKIEELKQTAPDIEQKGNDLIRSLNDKYKDLQ